MREKDTVSENNNNKSLRFYPELIINFEVRNKVKYKYLGILTNCTFPDSEVRTMITGYNSPHHLPPLPVINSAKFYTQYRRYSN